MSWSICFIGKPEKVVEALEEQSGKFSGDSSVEYNAALPHFKALVAENFGSEQQIIKITASGHGYAVDGKATSRNCGVTIESIYGTIV
jgi:hypothetical protein